MRKLGDDYVKNEFRLHKTAKPEHAQQFFSAWEGYLGTIQRAGKDGRLGRDINDTAKTVLSEEQKQKLADLKVEASKLLKEDVGKKSSVRDEQG